MALPCSVLSRTSAHARWRVAMLLALGAALSGCVSEGQGPVADSSPGGATIAFESIDGPPPQVFERMVSILDSETKLRNIAAVSRQSPAAYRVRSYLAAQTLRGKTSIDWVWDVYDRNQRRTLRLAGTEPVGASAGNAWAAADDVTLRRIAQAGLGGLVAITGGSAPTETSPASQPSPASGSAIADAGASESSPSTTARSALSFASMDDTAAAASR